MNTIKGAFADQGNAPFFERMESVEELQKYRLIIEDQNRRLKEVERINLDLETRLEHSAKTCLAVEKQLLVATQELENEAKKWKHKCEEQILINAKLRETLSRTEKEMYNILQRKYELMRGPGGPGPGPGPGGGPPRREANGRLLNGGSGAAAGNRGGALREKQHKTSSLPTSRNGMLLENPFSIQEVKAPQEIRQRRMMSSLCDFMGL